MIVASDARSAFIRFSVLSLRRYNTYYNYIVIIYWTEIK